jgi:hypothetical protein
VHIQKAAGTTLKFILKNSLGVQHSDVNPVDPPYNRPFGAADLDFAKSTNPWLRSISSHEIIEPTRHLGGAVIPFTMLRDPVQRSISHYQDKVVRGRRALSFDEFIDDPANHNFQVRKIAGGEDLDRARTLLRDRFFFVGLAERFAESVRVLAGLCPWPLDVRCRPSNVAADRRVGDSLRSDRAAMERLRVANRLDQELWDYVDRVLLPGLAAGCGVVACGPPPLFPRNSFPWRYHSSHLYHKLVYRPLLKRERRRRAAHS